MSFHTTFPQPAQDVTNNFLIGNFLVEEVNLSYQRDLVLEHLLSLDEESRNNRFCGNVGDRYIESFVDSLSKERGDRLYGIFQRGVEPVAYDVFALISSFSPQVIVPQFVSSIIGLSHISIYDSGNNEELTSAELALSVLGPYQKRGLGSMLVEDAILYRARELGIGKISCECLYTNRKVQELLKREGSEIDLDVSSNSSQGLVRIPPKDLDYILKRVIKTPLEITSMMSIGSFR